MSARIGAVEHMRCLFAVHTAAGIGYGYLYIPVSIGSTNAHTTAARCKLTRIVGYGIHHKERQRSVGLYDSRGRFYDKVNTLHGKPHPRLAHNIEEGL